MGWGILQQWIHPTHATLKSTPNTHHYNIHQDVFSHASLTPLPHTRHHRYHITNRRTILPYYHITISPRIYHITNRRTYAVNTTYVIPNSLPTHISLSYDTLIPALALTPSHTRHLTPTSNPLPTPSRSSHYIQQSLSHTNYALLTASLHNQTHTSSHHYTHTLTNTHPLPHAHSLTAYTEPRTLSCVCFSEDIDTRQ